MKKEGINTLMMKCVILTENKIWKSFFENMARGKYPPGITIHKNVIQGSQKGKEIHYKLDSKKSTQEIQMDLMNLFKEHVQNNENHLSVGQGHTNWTQVKRKVIRDTLLERYVLERSLSYQLTHYVAKRLLSLLIIGLMFKTISSKNIFYSDGYIEEIEGFKFIPKKVLITKNFFHSKMRDEVVSTIQTPCYLSESWNLYLQELQTR